MRRRVIIAGRCGSATTTPTKCTHLQLAGRAEGGALVNLSLQGRVHLIVGVAHNGGAPGADCTKGGAGDRETVWPAGSMLQCGLQCGKHAIPTKHDSGQAAAVPPRLQPSLHQARCSKTCQQSHELQNQRAGAP